MDKKEKIGVKGTWRIKKYDAKTGTLKDIKEFKNRVVNEGLQLLCKAMIDEGYTEGITYVALGDSDTAVDPGNTTLNNETSRFTFTSRERVDQSIILQAFLTTAQGNDVHYEIGGFGNGATAVADSGDMFNHHIFTGGEEKDNTETWTIELQIDFTHVATS